MTNATASTLIAAGLSKSMAYHAMTGVRSISVPLALWLYENDGLKVGPLEGRTSREIAVLRQIYEPKAPDSVVKRRQQRAA